MCWPVRDHSVSPWRTSTSRPEGMAGPAMVGSVGGPGEWSSVIGAPYAAVAVVG
ncbi:hypothetical protein [Ornithinimicrobium kibberense]|uniref:hypothetical protein n=1 Tax=Ornithinimicrobium kibberense TaxID=282060 RepID=UPI00360613C1